MKNVKTLAWKHYHFKLQTYYDCLKLHVILPDQKSSQYWKKSATFVKSLEHTYYEDMTVKQRNWAHNIRVELRNRGY